MKIQFLADENIALSVVKDLRKAGFNIKDIKEEKLQGSCDEEILELANREHRILLTHDKDFASIILTHKILSYGVILIRMKNQSPISVATSLLKILQSNVLSKLEHSFTTLSETHITIHPL